MDSKALSGQEGNQPTVLDRLPFNLTQLLAFAMQKPRDQMEAMDRALSQLRATPQFAEKAYYSLPFKKWVNGKQVEEIVTGPSIKAATALTGCWGNNVEGGFLGAETEDYVDVFGYFFDYETGKLTVRPWRVSKTYRTQKGEVQKWRYDMLQKQIMAGVSKAIRNADLNGLPAGYVAEYYAEAMKIAARGGKVAPESAQVGDGVMEADAADIQRQLEKCLAQFETFGVERKEVQDYVARHPELDTEEAVAAHLVGLLTALEDQQTTIDDVFTVPGNSEIPEPQKTTPAASKPAATGAKDPNRKRMQSRFAGSTCAFCKKPIKKGDWIYKNALDLWAHEETC